MFFCKLLSKAKPLTQIPDPAFVETSAGKQVRNDGVGVFSMFENLNLIEIWSIGLLVIKQVLWEII
jgi:hypothetical protein